MDTKNKKTKQRGQSFIEFILLLCVVMMLAYGFLFWVNRGVGERWKQIIGVVSSPDPQNIQQPSL
jgi:hypothetical protein